MYTAQKCSFNSTFLEELRKLCTAVVKMHLTVKILNQKNLKVWSGVEKWCCASDMTCVTLFLVIAQIDELHLTVLFNQYNFILNVVLLSMSTQRGDSQQHTGLLRQAHLRNLIKYSVGLWN